MKPVVAIWVVEIAVQALVEGEIVDYSLVVRIELQVANMDQTHPGWYHILWAVVELLLDSTDSPVCFRFFLLKMKELLPIRSVLRTEIRPDACPCPILLRPVS